jgi:hypothetical protein
MQFAVIQKISSYKDKKDIHLEMWLYFLKNSNGISVFHDRFWITYEDFQLYSDSAGGKTWGLGYISKATGVTLSGLSYGTPAYVHQI